MTDPVDVSTSSRSGSASLAPYPPGKPIEELEREYGITDSIKLASNENPLGPSPRAVAAMRAALGDVHRYPDGGGFYLQARLAERLGVARRSSSSSATARTRSSSSSCAPSSVRATRR